MLKKVLALTLSILLIASGIASALTLGDVIQAVKDSEFKAPALPENTLTSRPDESVYVVMKLDDTGNFLKWLVSDYTIGAFMPLVYQSKNSADITGTLELVKLLADTTPLKSVAVIVGMPKPETGKKTSEAFIQAAFTVNDELASTVSKVADGSAVDSDFAKLLLGADNPLAAMASTMIKAEKLDGNNYRIDTGLFVRADNGIVLVAETLDELKAMSGNGEKLFGKVSRKFDDKDFLFIHADYGTIDALDDENELDKADEVASKYFDDPLNVEFSFKSDAEKFVLSTFVNLREALKEEYLNKSVALTPVKGSYLKPSGSKTPLMMFAGHLMLSALKDQKETKDVWSALLKAGKVVGLSESDILTFCDGAFSLTVNDSVNFEIMKVPAVYASQTVKSGVASAIFEKLSKSKYFHKVQDGVLQLDTSISPVSCLVNTDGDALGVSLAETSSISSKPVVKPLLEELLNATGISALWLDFDAARSWIMDAENGVFAMLVPMSKMMGFSEIVEAAQDILSAEFSVPSFSFMAEDLETFRMEFATVKINPENGVATKLVKLYLKYKK